MRQPVPVPGAPDPSRPLAALADGTRRRLIAALAGAAAWPGRARAAAPTGWVSPRLPAPALAITGIDGQRRALPTLLAGKVSAVQLMFTGCSASCPLQGALFAALAGRLRGDDTQLLSISIDALGDTVSSLAAWQGRFGRHPAWRTGLPRVGDVDRLADFLKGVNGPSGTHTAQVFVFDRQARLCYRTGDAPEAAWLQALLAHVAGDG